MLKNLFMYGGAFILAISFMAFGNYTPSKNEAMVTTLILDAGHGGNDVGARGKFSTEKDICLAVSLKVFDLLKKELPDVQVLMTRNTDVYPTLHERSDFANKNKGDLFVSIHVNSAPQRYQRVVSGYRNKTTTRKGKKVTTKVPIYTNVPIPNTAKGTETYIWGADKGDAKEVALRENAPMLLEENYQEKYGNIDPNSPEFVVMASLKTKQFFKRSATLAMHIEEEFKKVGRTSRDVKQRAVGIWILQATAMPSVLIETGFISNPEEEDYLNSEAGQQELTQCIVTAIKRYKVEQESSMGNLGKATRHIGFSSKLLAKDANIPTDQKQAFQRWHQDAFLPTSGKRSNFNTFVPSYI